MGLPLRQPIHPGGARGTAARDRLRQHLTPLEQMVREAREAGQIVQAKGVIAEETKAKAVIRDACYLRPCFICGKRRDCQHREREVELAIAASPYGIGAPLG